MSNHLGIQKILLYKLVNIIKPFIYQGLLSIYLDAESISDNNEVLMVFQGLLSKVPKWTNDDLQREVERINSKSKVDYLHNLLKASIKSYISIFIEETKDTYVDPEYYENIKLEEYIHHIYKLVAREIFNNPILFYSQISDIERLNNIKIIMEIITNSIENAIVELLPFQYLIDEYLNVEIYNQQIKLDIPNESIVNLDQLKQKVDLIKPINDIKQDINNQLNQEGNVNQMEYPILPANHLFPIQQGGNQQIRNNQQIKNNLVGGKDKRKLSSKSSRSYDSYTASNDIKRKAKEFLSNSKISESNLIDNIIKKKHNEAKGLNNTETSASYEVDNVNNYEEVFSNNKEIRKKFTKKKEKVEESLSNSAKMKRSHLRKKKKMELSTTADTNLFTNDRKSRSGNRNHRKMYKV
jgi:hypothetical protein